MTRFSSAMGFTLVELMVIVAIVSILAAIALPRISTSATTAKQNACATNIDSINTQIEIYRATNGSWPADLDTIVDDANFFPDGAPSCDLPSGAYSMGADYRTSCAH